MLRLMDAEAIEFSETRVDETSSDTPVTEHFAIYWMPASVIYVWCLNTNINSSQ